jgi:hypothetical protein
MASGAGDMKAFDIQVYEKFDVSFRLVVCKTRAEMIREISKQILKFCSKDKLDTNTAGIFCPTYHKIEKDAPGEFSSNVFGTMFLNLQDLTGEIVAHECAHAAFSYEHSVRRYTGDFGDDDFDEQESYCYFLGYAFEKVRAICKEKFKAAL